MNIYPENFRNFPESEKKIWMSVKDWVEAASADYQFDNTAYPELYSFKLVSTRRNIAAKKSITAAKDGASFTLLVAKFEIVHEKFSRFNKTSRDIKEEFTHFGGYMEIKEKEAGRAYFRPESAKGSLSISLDEIEINETISKTHRSWVENSDLFLEKMGDKLDALTEIFKDKENKDLRIEFDGNAILFSTLKPIDDKVLETTLTIGLALDKIFGNDIL
jgi:hypothetical protein